MRAPRVTLDGAGFRVEYDAEDGVRSFPLSADAALELVALLTSKLNDLKQSPELQAQLGAAVAKKLFAWFSK